MAVPKPSFQSYGRTILVEDALKDARFNARDCFAAMRGERIPRSLGHPASRMAVIRGIRYHDGFAPQLRGALDAFTRALNARSIMSGEMPDMQQPEEIPYCIWYPEIPSEAACRELVARYPQMLYHVGRACAIAGHVELYKELTSIHGMLPEVHIAEEARECNSLAIYEMIMAQPRKYDIMNDYDRTINTDSPRAAYLNGDTCVRAYLDMRQIAAANFNRKSYFNIAEDMGFDDHETHDPYSEVRLPEPIGVADLLYQPLPSDLPFVQKDLLILMAAYYGNIDRYARLRRPRFLYAEIDIVVRGIHHNTMFAKWWSTQAQVASQDRWLYDITNAVAARYIMSNDLSLVASDKRKFNPRMIWYPDLAHPKTYEELARCRPDMKLTAARACIVAGSGYGEGSAYEASFHNIDPEPTETLMAEARASRSPHFLRFLERKLEQQGGGLAGDNDASWLKRPHSNLRSSNRNTLFPKVGANLMTCGQEGIYQGFQAEADLLELSVIASEELKDKAGKKGSGIWLYEDDQNQF